MSIFPMSICWRCSTCKVCGVVEVTRKTSLTELLQIIVRDHAEKEPTCRTGDKEIHILNEEAAA